MISKCYCANKQLKGGFMIILSGAEEGGHAKITLATNFVLLQNPQI